MLSRDLEPEQRLSRRRFLRFSVAGVAGATLASLLSACGGGGSLKLLRRAHFVPAYDAFLDKWAADWGEKNKVEVTVDHILSGELASKLAAEVAAGSGH